ncbi:MAG: TIGR02302 family protein [Allorhizobium sp.]
MNAPRQGSRKGAYLADPALARRVAIKRALARAVLFVERVLPLFLPVLGIAALFVSLAWFGVYRALPEWLRIGLVFALTFAFFASFLPFARLRVPTPADGDRLLEDRNHLPHQPVGVQQDEPAFDTPFGRALWREHQRRMAEQIAALDAGLPQPDIARFDRYALRTVPALLLVTAYAFSGSNSAGSIADAFRQAPPSVTAPDLRIDAWITPPAYTGRAPLFLTGTDAAIEAITTVNVPQFSEITVRITGGSGDESVFFTPADAEEALELAANKPEDAPAVDSPDAGTAPAPAPAAPRVHALKIADSGRLAVGNRLWTIDVIPDKAPEIAFDGIPRRSANGALEIGFIGTDDYGLSEAHADIVPVEDGTTGATPLYSLPEYKLDLPHRNSREIKGTGSHNLTEHPLAGKKVRITLSARDGAGQTGRSQPYEMVLPARNFIEPLAAAVAEERQVFSLDTRALPEAIALNEALTLRADETIPNLSHFLLIRSALARMKLARSTNDLKDTSDYLWEIALGIDDGDLSLAERRLRDAQQALNEALERDAPDAEIAKLMQELRSAMQDFMTAMAERQPNADQQQSNQAQNIIRQRDLENMMDQIENLARSGNRDAAQQMLSELQRMMNNLQAGRPQRGNQQQNSQARQQIDKLGELMQEQQKLMDETFQLDQALQDRMQRGDPGDGEDGEFLDQPGDKPRSPTDRMTKQQLEQALKDLRARQEGLGEKLKELQKGLEALGVKPGDNFGKAGEEMKGAGKALGQGEGGQAVDGQGKALEALRQGARDMMGQMQAMQQGQGQGQGQGPGQSQSQNGGQGGRDPLGRPRATSGPDTGEGVKVPDEIDVQRAREILDAIRKKLGDNPNQETERRYLERLLDIR